MTLKFILQRLEQGKDLHEEEMIEAMNLIMTGMVSTEDLCIFLKSLSEKGEAVSEIAGGAKVMREKALKIHAPYDTLDCCGTGGSGISTYNISTAVALICAACGVPVAKHGNRAATSKSGTADVLEALGVNLDVPPAALEEALEDYRFCFLMAPAHHKSMRHVAEARKKLGTRTIFNLLGPLSNPASTRLQLLGVNDRKWLRPMAETLKELGSKRAWVVHGKDGLDEISISGPTYIAKLENDDIEETELTPEEFGLPSHDLQEILGGDAAENAKALRALLQGKTGAYRDIVLANAAAALLIHGSAKDLKEGVAKAAEAIDQGFALDLLSDYIAFTRGIDDAA